MYVIVEDRIFFTITQNNQKGSCDASGGSPTQVLLLGLGQGGLFLIDVGSLWVYPIW